MVRSDVAFEGCKLHGDSDSAFAAAESLNQGFANSQGHASIIFEFKTSKMKLREVVLATLPLLILMVP